MKIGTFTKVNKEIEINYFENSKDAKTLLTVDGITEKAYANQTKSGFAFRLDRGSEIVNLLGADNTKTTFLLTELAEIVYKKVTKWAYEKASKEGAIFFE